MGGNTRSRGSLVPRGKNRWLVRWYVGRKSNGKRHYRSKTVHGTKKEAQRYLTKMLRELDQGVYTEPSKENLASYLDKWLETVAKQRVRKRTYHDYVGYVERYVVPFLGSYRLHQLTPDLIKGLHAELLEQDLSPSTIQKAHSILSSALRTAVEWGKLPRNVAALVRPPKKRKKKTMRALSREELQTFLEAAEGNRWYALWYTLVSTGLRPGEALGLTWSDISGQSCSVQRTLVRDKSGWRFEDTKTSSSRRTVVLGESLKGVLDQHRRDQLRERLKAGESYEDRDLVFSNQHGGPLDWRTTVRRYFRPIAKRAGLEGLRPYDLRHTHATLYLANGIHPKVVSERLGHSSTAMTMDVYSHVLPGMQEEAVKQLDEQLFAVAGS